MAIKFKNGDQVRFLNDVGGGTISRIDEDGLVYVQTFDGFELPVLSKELVRAGNFTVPDQAEDEVPLKRVADTAIQPSVAHVRKPQKKLPVNISAGSPVNLLIGFIPEDPGPVFNSALACYLINDSPYFAYYFLGSFERGNYYYISSGLIESQTKNLMSVFNQTAISKIAGLHLQLIWLSEGRYARKTPLDTVLDIQLVNFSKESYYHENIYFDEKAVLFPVTGKDEWTDPMSDIEIPDSARAVKDDDPKTENQPVKNEIPTDTLEIDLHMDEADLQKSQFSLSGILSLQMSRFHAALEEAVSEKYRRLVVIHGVGQGTLKMQIRKELQEKYPQYIFQDASFREYGFGATMVHLIGDKKQ